MENLKNYYLVYFFFIYGELKDIFQINSKQYICLLYLMGHHRVITLRNRFISYDIETSSYFLKLDFSVFQIRSSLYY